MQMLEKKGFKRVIAITKFRRNALNLQITSVTNVIIVIRK